MKKVQIISLLTLFVLFVPLLVFAQNLGLNMVSNMGTGAGYGDKSLPEVVGAIIQIVLSLLGMIATIILIVGGFMWMTSAGNPEKVEKAKQLMGAAIIGLIIVVLAYAAANFIISK